jgi:hypothetical protein
MEIKQLWGYDKKNDKYVMAELVKGNDIVIYAVGFISINKYLITYYSDISNPEKASFKIEGEFKSPNVFEQTEIVNGKPLNTITATRTK